MASRESSDLLVVSNLGGVRAFPVWPQVLKVVYHLPQIPGNFGWDVNGKRFLGASQWKIPGTNGNSEKVVPFPGWDVSNGNSFTIYKFLEFRTSFML